MFDTAEWLKKVDALTKESCGNQNFSVEWLASALSISPRQLQRRLLSLSGLTPKKYITEIRLLLAKEILEKRQAKNIAQVTYMVGFQKNSYFVKIFKERFGIHPKCYLCPIT